MPTIDQLISALDDDIWRKKNPFSDEIKIACDVLLNPYSRDDERKEAIRGWLVAHQPCVFGRAAAKADRLFISIVDDELFSRGDDAVREKLLLDKRTWKQWSLKEKGRHGFLAAFLSPRLMFAAPNEAVRLLSEHFRTLFISETERDAAGNDVSSEWLYLEMPSNREYRKFRVILDYFAAAGDKRWWHDHRFPGGVAFTLNSLGHMVRTKEFYEALGNPTEWASRMAMLTIDGAWAHPEFGKATRLVDLADGKPRLPMKCPFGDPGKLPKNLQNKDWTTYTGFYHTDHSVRKEFFDQAEKPDRSRGEYLLDFSYIGGSGGQENTELMHGATVSIEEIKRDIGSPEEWRFATPAAVIQSTRPEKEEAAIAKALETIRNEWMNAEI